MRKALGKQAVQGKAGRTIVQFLPAVLGGLDHVRDYDLSTRARTFHARNIYSGLFGHLLGGLRNLHAGLGSLLEHPGAVTQISQGAAGGLLSGLRPFTHRSLPGFGGGP